MVCKTEKERKKEEKATYKTKTWSCPRHIFLFMDTFASEIEQQSRVEQYSNEVEIPQNLTSLQ